MKSNLKKLACLVLSFSMIASAAACSKKKDDDKGSSGCTEVADTFLDAVVSLDSKKIKKLEKNLGIDGEIVDALTEFAENDYFTAVMEKASYEIDEDSVSEKKKKASCEATVKLPDYESAFEDADGDYDDFVDAIDGQKEKKYQDVTLTLEFEVEDDEYTLTNAEDVLADLYEPMADVLTSAPSPKPTEPTDGPVTTDPDPTDTEPTDTEPTDTTKATDDTTSTTAPAGPAGTLKDIPAKKVTVTPDTFTAAIRAVDAKAADGVISFGSETNVGDYTVTDYYSAQQEDWNVLYICYVFKTAEDAKGYFDTYTEYMESYATSYVVEADWGYVAYQSGDYAFSYYLSDNYLVTVTSLDGSAENIDKVSGFFEALFA